MRSRSMKEQNPRMIGKKSESGQAIVELSLVMVFVLIPLLIGTLEFGRAAYAYVEVSNAARSAVQYGAQTDATSSDTGGMLNAAQSDYSLDPTKLSLPQSTLVCTCSDTGSVVSCSDSTVCTGAHLEKTLSVQSQATFDPGFYEPFISKTFTLNGYAVQKVLQ
jgi:Flp pilus assembly protein TadG